MRLGLLVAVHERPELTAFTLAANLAAARSNKELEVIPMAVGTLGVGREAAGVPAGWLYVEHANVPLGAKWNAGMQALRHANLDSVMIFGSDDLVSSSVFLKASILSHPVPINQPGWFGVRDCYVYHGASEKLRWWKGYPEKSDRFGQSIGTCRTFNRAWLDRWDWKPWPDHVDRGLDEACSQAKNEGTIVSMEDCGAILDIKANPLTDLGSFWEMNGKEIPREILLAHFPAEVLAELWPLCDPLKRAEKVFFPAADPKLTVCLMVKNERNVISETLASLAGVADEVLVLDTGSTDGTPEIAEAYGATVRREEADLPFDFGYWRNESMKGARGKWVMILDGDEWVSEWGEIISMMDKLDPSVDAIAAHHQVIGLNSAEGLNPIMRVFRGEKVRSGAIHYEYPIHHQVRGTGRFAVAKAMTQEPFFDPVESARRAIPTLEKMLSQSSIKLVNGKSGKALGGRGNERQHALLYLSRSHAMLGQAAVSPEEREEHYKQSALFAGELVDRNPEQLGAWLVLLAVSEQVMGLGALEPLVDKAVAAHPKAKDVRWWRMRVEAAILATLQTQPEAYPLVPQRWPLYMPNLNDLAGFLWMTFS